MNDPQDSKPRREPAGGRAMDRMVRNEILNQEARMLPTGTLSGHQINQVRRDLRDYLDDHEITIEAARREIGYGASVLSQWLAGKYKGSDEKVARAVDHWLERRRRRDASRCPNEYVETWVAEQMRAAVHLADRRVKMAAIVAPSGSGKDMVISVLAEQMQGVVVYADPEMTPKKLLEAIARQINVAPRSRNTNVLNRVVEKLTNSNRVVFINEAQQLRQACAATLRAVHDQARVPVCLFGSAQIFRFIDDRDLSSGGGQFWRRCIKIDIANRLGKVQDPDNPGRMRERLFTAEEVRRFLAMKKLRLAREVVDVLAAIACLQNHGTLGLVGEIVETCVDIFRDQEITVDLVYDVLPMLLDDEADRLLEDLAEYEESQAKQAVA